MVVQFANIKGDDTKHVIGAEWWLSSSIFQSWRIILDFVFVKLFLQQLSSRVRQLWPTPPSLTTNQHLTSRAGPSPSHFIAAGGDSGRCHRHSSGDLTAGGHQPVFLPSEVRTKGRNAPCDAISGQHFFPPHEGTEEHPLQMDMHILYTQCTRHHHTGWHALHHGWVPLPPSWVSRPHTASTAKHVVEHYISTAGPWPGTSGTSSEQMVPKPTARWRLDCNYRWLNDAMTPVCYQVLHIQDFSHSGSDCFSKCLRTIWKGSLQRRILSAAILFSPKSPLHWQTVILSL